MAIKRGAKSRIRDLQGGVSGDWSAGRSDSGAEGPSRKGIGGSAWDIHGFVVSCFLFPAARSVFGLSAPDPLGPRWRRKVRSFQSVFYLLKSIGRDVLDVQPLAWKRSQRGSADTLWVLLFVSGQALAFAFQIALVSW